MLPKSRQHRRIAQVSATKQQTIQPMPTHQLHIQPILIGFKIDQYGKTNSFEYSRSLAYWSFPWGSVMLIWACFQNLVPCISASAFSLLFRILFICCSTTIKRHYGKQKSHWDKSQIKMLSREGKIKSSKIQWTVPTTISGLTVGGWIIKIVEQNLGVTKCCTSHWSQTHQFSLWEYSKLVLIKEN